jgi:hypothetical protein
MERKDRVRYRSIFWPILLIGVGVTWLLVNLGVISGVDWRILWRFWPLILIAIGLDIIFARRTPILGAILGLGTIALVILILALAPSLGLIPSTEIYTDRFTEPVGNVTSAEVEIELSVGPITIDAYSDSTQLLDAEIKHIGEVFFESRGEEKKTIRLEQEEGSDFSMLGSLEEELEWDIGLSPDVPLFLQLHGGVGKAQLDLSDLQLTGVDLELDVGDMEVILPETGEVYTVKVKGGVGEVHITIPEGVNVRVDLDGDVGDFIIEVPEDAAVRLDAETDVGDIRVPSSMRKVSGEEDDFIGESGVWETTGYSSADRRITIEFKGGVGRLTIR